MDTRASARWYDLSMPDRFLPRSPALASLRPRAPVFEEILDERADVLCVACGAAGEVERMGGAGGGLEGFYRLLGPDELFLKVVPADHRQRQVEAGAIARFVSGHGVRTSVDLDGYPRDLPEGQVLFAAPYLEVRYAGAAGDDLARVGSALGRLHRVLADAPFADDVRRLGEQRDRELADLLCRASDEGVAELAGGSDAFPEAPSQAVHGDLNAGNVVFPVSGGEPLVLDFEDCRFSHRPRLVDVAMALERFAMVAADDDERAFDLGLALVNGYLDATDIPPPAPGDLGRTLRALSVRALALLAALRREGRAVADAEWDKFLHLLDQVRARGSLLRRLEEILR